jgi:4'-phosphopantetheinyl transferase
VSNVIHNFDTSQATQIHIWRIALGDLAEDELLTSLSADEQDRAAKMRHEQTRRCFIVSHYALRDILSGYLGVGASEVRFESLANGKPVIASAACQSRFSILPGSPRCARDDKELHFSLSHSADLALCAITNSSPIGVDVEKTREIRYFNQFVERFLSEAELKWLRDHPSHEQLPSFFRVWTAKEAYLKAVGVGLRAELRDLDVVSPSPKLRRWSILPLDVEDGFVAAVAVQDERAYLTYRDWSLYAS